MLISREKKIIFWIWIFFHVEIKDEVIQNEPKENNFKVRRGAKQYPCEKCETIFPSLRRLNQHIAKIHESKKNCHVCHICQMRFSKRGTMESHMSKSHAVIGNRKVEVEEPENNNCDQCKYNTIFIFLMYSILVTDFGYPKPGFRILEVLWRQMGARQVEQGFFSFFAKF